MVRKRGALVPIEVRALLPVPGGARLQSLLAFALGWLQVHQHHSDAS
jgi:hypothetical protein